MRYRSMMECVQDLQQHSHLIRIKQPVDPNLEMAEIQRRVFANQGPALFFENVKGSPFPAVSNLFGTMERSRFIFRSTLKWVKTLIDLKADPVSVLQNPWRLLGLPLILFNIPPIRLAKGAVLAGETTVDQLPQIRCWPKDGGGFVLLPQVYTENQAANSIFTSNLGMYRIQLGGNQYQPNRQVGLHYQIRRDIGIHHHKALELGQPLRVSIFIGGPPAHTFAAVMPLPEGLPEVAFAGGLAGRNFRFTRINGQVVSLDADFCITGLVHPNQTLPEGPFGDHLGYYSLVHDFPVLQVDKVYHRKDAVWPFTVVGRPPQEDTMFGALIHEITSPMVPKSLPGVKAIHAVDASGVHPLLLAIGSERYEPYRERKPQELLTLANSILGFGHCSLAKYLLIIAGEDNPRLDIHHIDEFFMHLLERVDWRNDLHFQTRTTMDTLDYSGTGLNSGSKLVIAAAGKPKRRLNSSLPVNLNLPEGFSAPQVALPGILVVQGPGFLSTEMGETSANRFAQELSRQLDNGATGKLDPVDFPLILIADDSEFTARTLNNFLWVTFTRSNPSHDIYGVKAFTDHKHWGCEGSLIIDVRLKPHHAPPLEEDSEVSRKVDQMAAKGGELHGLI